MSSKVPATPCPHCLDLGIFSPVDSQGASIRCKTNSSHSFNDREEFTNLLASAKSRHPELVPTVAPPVKGAGMAEFYVDAETKKLFEDILGQPIGGPSELKGAIWRLKEDLTVEKKTSDKLRADMVTAKLKGGAADEFTFSLRVPEQYLEVIKESAEVEGKPLPEYLQDYFTNFVESYFVLAATGR